MRSAECRPSRELRHCADIELRSSPIVFQSHQTRLGFTHFQAGHPALPGLLLKRFPRDEERVPFRNLPGIFVGALGQLLRLAQQKDRFRRQIVEQRPEAGLRVEG